MSEDLSPIQTFLQLLQGSRAQSLLQRVDELRAMLLRWAIVLFVLVGVGFYFARDIIGFLKIPLAVASAFPDHQKKYVMPFFISSLALFGIGVTFCYYVMLPVGLKWLVGFGGDQASAIISVGEYVDMLMFMILAFGAAFQLPLLVIALERLGLVQQTTLKKHRGGILVAILIIAAVIAPSPDPVSQLSLAAPMYLMFEGALLVIGRLQMKNSLPV